MIFEGLSVPVPQAIIEVGHTEWLRDGGYLLQFFFIDIFDITKVMC